jgi:cell division protein FtsW
MLSASLKTTRPKLPDYDVVLAWIVVALLSIGLVMVYSASIATAEES